MGLRLGVGIMNASARPNVVDFVGAAVSKLGDACDRVVMSTATLDQLATAAGVILSGFPAEIAGRPIALDDSLPVQAILWTDAAGTFWPLVQDFAAFERWFEGST